MMTRERKVEEVAAISDKLGKSKATFLVDFKGLNVEEVTTLRKQLQPIDSEMKVVRNTLAKLALKGFPEVESFWSEQLVGTNAMVFSYEDPSAAAKVLSEFGKEAEELADEIWSDGWQRYERRSGEIPSNSARQRRTACKITSSVLSTNVEVLGSARSGSSKLCQSVECVQRKQGRISA
jgi:hypothetical protein